MPELGSIREAMLLYEGSLGASFIRESASGNFDRAKALYVHSLRVHKSNLALHLIGRRRVAQSLCPVPPCDIVVRIGALACGN